MPGHLRRYLSFHRLDRIDGVGSCLAPEDRGDVVVQIARKITCRYVVLDRRRIGIAGDGVDVGLVSGERSVEDRRKIGIVDVRKIRQAERTVPTGERVTIEVDGLCHEWISGCGQVAM